MSETHRAQKIVPNIWCNGNAEQMAAFYAEAFTNASYEVQGRYPETGLPDFQQSLAGQALTVAVTIGDYRLMLLNVDDSHRPNPAISFMLNFDPLMFEGSEDLACQSLDRLWAALGDGGFALMPLGEYPFSKRYGWVQDRFGVSWQLMLTDPAGDPRPFILPCLLFEGRAQNHAGEAIGHYLDVFSGVEGGAELGAYVLHSEKQGPAEPGTIMFSDFRIDDQWFVAMDSAVEQDFSFTPGLSLMVLCDGQREIDRFWNGLSTVPEAERCGWLVDRFGVSWQIIPDNMGELMSRPGSHERLMGMKKIVVAEF